MFPVGLILVFTALFVADSAIRNRGIVASFKALVQHPGNVGASLTALELGKSQGHAVDPGTATAITAAFSGLPTAGGGYGSTGNGTVTAAYTGGPYTGKVANSGSENYRPDMANQLVDFGEQLKSKGVSVTEHKMFGGVHPVHAVHSLHYINNAFDCTPGKSGMSLPQIYNMAIAAGFGAKGPGYPGHNDHIHVDTSFLRSSGAHLVKISSAVAPSPTNPTTSTQYKGLV